MISSVSERASLCAEVSLTPGCEGYRGRIPDPSTNIDTASASGGRRSSCERPTAFRTRVDDKAAASRDHDLARLGRALVGLQITTIMFFGLWSNPKPPPEEPIPEKVPLPLQALDRCSVCESERKVRLCANCGEVRDPDIVSGDGTCLSRCSLATLLLKPMPESRLADSQECLR